MDRLKTFPALLLAALVMSLPGCESTPQSGGARDYLTDSAITSRVKERFFNEPSLRAAELNVRTVMGVVHLSGSVSSRGDLKKAAEIAREVGGVHDVTIDLQVK